MINERRINKLIDILLMDMSLNELIIHLKNIRIKKIDKIKRIKGRSPLVSYWNKLSFTKKHKDPNSKVYAYNVNMIRQLKEGVLGLKNDIDKDWLKSRGMKRSLTVKKFTSEEIKMCMRRLNMMLTPGYWPKDKAWIKRMSLHTLIYNDISRKSWFLAVMAEEPKTLIKSFTISIYPEIAKEFQSMVNGCNDHDEMIIDRAIKSLIKFYRGLPSNIVNSYGHFPDVCYDEAQFCREYGIYISKQDWLDNISAKLFRTNSKLFKRWLDEEWGEDSNALNKKLSSYL